MRLAQKASTRIDKMAHSSSNPLATLTKQLRSRDDYRKVRAAEHLAKMGTQEAAEALRTVLEDSDLFVRRETRKAIRDNLGSATPEFKEVVFNSVALGLREADASWASPEGHFQGEGCEDVIKLLPQLDRERAIAELTKPDTLRVNHPNLRELIHTLTLSGAALDDAVFDWLAVLRPCVAEGRRDVTGRSALVYGKLLRAAAFQQHPKTAAWIDDMLENREPVLESVALEGAAEARAILAGLSLTLSDDLTQRFESEGLDSLSPPEQLFVAVKEMHQLTELYGIGDYVVNASPVMLPLALQGLTAMGERFMSPKLQRAIELRDRQPPDTLDEAGTQALIGTIDDLPWNEEVKYTNPMLLAHLYAAANAEAFWDKCVRPEEPNPIPIHS
ncbi:MAG: hypothetical protein ACO1TE_02280 [Prosthecobacter sp.]